MGDGRTTQRLRQRGTRWTPAKCLLKKACAFFAMATLSGAVKDSESPLLEWNRLPSWKSMAVLLWPAMSRVCGFKMRSAMGVWHWEDWDAKKNLPIGLEVFTVFLLEFL